MGHKAVVIFDMDHLDAMRKDPAAFVQRMELALLAHRRTGGSVSMQGATVANVVWSGHSSLSPKLVIEDFQARNITYEDVTPIVAEHKRQVKLDSPN